MRSPPGEPSSETARASEALLIERLATLKAAEGARLWCTSPGRAQLAWALASAAPRREVTCTFLDLFQAKAAAALGAGVPEQLHFDCAAELPKGPFAAAFVPLRAGADSEVAWELLQHAWVELADGGELFTAVDEPRDRWVAGRMEALFGSRFSRHATRDAIAYRGVKRGSLKKVKGFECTFAFRDRGRLIQAVSRPGVFSHRRLDLGARALIESLAVVEENGLERDRVETGMRILDYGCGAGVVGLAAGLRAPDVMVHFADSMPRAVACALRGAELNGLAGATGAACDDGRVGRGAFDLALLNPPYYSHHRISEIFVAAACDSLKRGGKVHVVTKQPEWFQERLPRDFTQVRVRELRTYTVLDGVRR